jgi:cytochrome c553
MRGNHNNNRRKRNKKEKTEQSNKIELSKEAFVSLVRDAQKGREKNGMEANNSEDDMDSIRDKAKYYENMRQSHSNNSNDSDSL